MILRDPTPDFRMERERGVDIGLMSFEEF